MELLHEFMFWLLMVILGVFALASFFIVFLAICKEVDIAVEYVFKLLKKTD